MDMRRLHLWGAVMRLYQQIGLQKFLRWSGLLRLLPKRLRELEAMTPTIHAKFSEELIAPINPAVWVRKYRVAMLIGCAQDLIFSDINRGTVEVLARDGCERVTPPDQQWCASMAHTDR